MNRIWREVFIVPSGVPHVRGDEPAVTGLAETSQERSPRAWG